MLILISSAKITFFMQNVIYFFSPLFLGGMKFNPNISWEFYESPNIKITFRAAEQKIY